MGWLILFGGIMCHCIDKSKSLNELGLVIEKIKVETENDYKTKDYTDGAKLLMIGKANGFAEVLDIISDMGQKESVELFTAPSK